MIKRLRGITAAFLAIILLIVPSLPTAVKAGTHKIRDVTALKAAFIYNFTKFVTWPTPSCDSPAIAIGSLASGDVKLGFLAGRKSGSRIIKIVTKEQIKNGDIRCPTLVYVDRIDKLTRTELEYFRKNHILVVAEGKDAVEKGAIIALYFKDKKIRFDINLNAAREAHITLSSNLLRLATKVIK